MVSADKLAVFLKLQQTVLDTEDSNLLLYNLLIQSLNLLPSVGLPYEFVSVAFIDANNVPQRTYCASMSCPPNQPLACNAVVSLENLFVKGGAWEDDLLWGKVVVSQDVSKLIKSSYVGFLKVKSVIIAPSHFGKKLLGALILASPREQSQVSQEEIEIVELIVHLSSLAYRIQDTQTSLVQITQEVYKMNAQLHQLDKLKDDFVSVASHELRTPMTAIRSYAWMALNRPDIPLSEKMKKYLSRTLISTERLINLVNDMLNVSRIEAGRIEIRPEIFDVLELTGEVIEEVSAKAAEKLIHLEVEKDKMPQIFADPDKFHQVLLNLVGNSLKFTSANGVISINFFTDGEVVEIAVADTGAGISSDDQSRLFKKFERLDSSYVAASTSGGTGLGLYISKSLIELMHGKIWAKSDGLGKGSTFTFSLPIATPSVLAEAEKYTNKPIGDAKSLEPVAI